MFARTRWILAGAAALVLALAACSSAPSRVSEAATTEPIHVSLGDFTISAAASLVAGQATTLHVTNDGKTIHQIQVEAGSRSYTTEVLQPGGSTQLKLPALAAGAYRFWCTIAGHAAAGMDTKIAAEAAGGGQGKTQAPISFEQMDAMHEAGVKAFPAKTAGLGGQIMAPTIVRGVKVFDLTTRAVSWEVSPGQLVDAYAYNGQVPGPEIHVRRGDRVRFVLHNRLPESTSIHFHGLTVPNAMDGVPYITQPVVKPGESFTYEFTIVDTPGTYMYHSHHNATIQVGRGLLGALIIDGGEDRWDVEQTMVLGDGELGFTLNGKGFPATAPIVARIGQRVLVRFMNEGQMIHPMHLHGFHFRVIARDGQPIPSPYSLDTVSVAPGERWDVEFVANQPGIWAFHCHILSHAESEHGMHGMVTAVIVK